MSAAQALASGLLASSPSMRSSGGASSAERGDTSFRDTLEEASRSREAPESEARHAGAERTCERKGAGNEDAAGEDRDEGAPQDGERAPLSRTDSTTTAELAAMLAQLGGAAGNGEGDAGFAVPTGVAAAAPGAAEETGETSPLLPGRIGEDGEPLDAEKLLALLKSGGGAAASTDAVVDKVDVKVTVAGQETHLALAPAPAEAVAATLSQVQGVAEGSASTENSEKAAALGAALSQAADDAAKPARTRGENAGAEIDAKADGRSAVRGPIGEQWGARSGLAFADQGIAGQDGRQSEGRGSSGSGSQQQGTATFMSMLAGASVQAKGPVGDTVDAGLGGEPVSEQIAAEMRAELKADGLGKTSSEGTVKVLSLELKPANLGAVTVRIALKDNAVTVHIEAQRHETLAVIEREREALTGALQSAGYSVDGITAAPQSEASRSLGSLSAAADSGSQSGQGGLQGQHNQGQGLGNSAGGQGRSSHAGSGQPGQRFVPDANDTNSGSIRRGAEELYV